MVPMRAHSSSVAAPAEPCSLRGCASATFSGLLLVGLLAGCGNGGGGGGASPPGGSGNIISGTAATGDPIAFGTVTLKGSLGAPAVATTDSKGNYSLNVSGSTPPFIMRVVPEPAGSIPLYSFADKSGTTNITPLTDLVLYEALGRSDIGTVFDSGNLSKLTVSSVNAAETMVRSNFLTQLTANGLSTATDLFRTPFIANGTGQDAVIQNTLVTKLSTGVYITDSGNLCEPYGRNVTGVTFAIDGMEEAYAPTFFGISALSNPFSNTPFELGYVRTSLEKACIWTGASRTEDSIYRFIWARKPEAAETRTAVESLKISLRLATVRNKLPINIVAHSWGTVIAYIALTELAGPLEQTPGDSLIRVDNLITMGSPIQCMAGGGCISTFLSSANVGNRIPPEFKIVVDSYGIQKPSNVIKWTNYWGLDDPISGRISASDQNWYVNCTGSIEGDIIRILPAQYPCNGFGVFAGPIDILKNHYDQYFPETANATETAVVRDVRNLIGSSQAASSPVPPVVQAPATVALPTPDAFTVTAGTPYCDTREPVGPAVKLTWSVSTNASFYRVFRDGKATGVQLSSSQLDFVNELGLVAGQTYSYKVQAMNANGTTWSTTAQVAIPADVCSPKFTSPSLGTINTSTVGYQPTLTANGNVTQVSVSWSGATSGSETWGRNDALWLNRVTSNPDGTLTLRPVVTQVSDPAGTTNWTVTLRDSTGATRTQNFSVNYQPTITGGGGDILLPDLVVDTVTATPTSAAPGASVTVTFTVRNQGAGAIPATLARIRLASGTTIQLTDPLLAEVTVLGLAAGAASTLSQPVTIPAGKAAGNYFMGVTANAPDGAPAESNNNNNQRTTPFTVENNTAGAGTLVVNGFASSYSTSTTPYTPLINLTGSGFASITQVSWTCTMPNGVSCTGSPYEWTSANNWNGGKFTQPTDTSVSVFPTLLTGATGEPTGTYSWSVTFSGAGQSVTKTFTVNYTPAAAAPAIPATPMNPSPGSTSSPGPTLGSSAVTVSWNASSGATLYIGGITDIAAGSDVVTISTSSTSAPATLSPGKQYRWYVFACNSSGCSSSSALYYFQTPAVTGTAPATPTGTAPGSTTSPGPTTSSTTVGLSWSAVSGATSYSLGVRDIATNVLVVDTIISSTSFNAGLASGKSYRWNVAACNSAGCSNFSTVLFFRTP